MVSNNINTTSKIIKNKDDIEPFELKSFVSNSEPAQTQEMRNVAVLKDNSTNDNLEPVLNEIKNLQASLLQIQQKVTNIETDGIKGKDLEKQVIEAMKDLKNYAQFFEQAAFQMETKILKSAIAIAQKIIAIEVGENSAKIAKETISSMMSKIKTASKVTIHLNPKDFVQLKDSLSLGETVSLQEDPNVTAGGVVIASDLGNFDGNIEAKVQTMLESLDAVI